MKKLENEYRQLMQNETPDLWERISAGIDAKIAEDNEEKVERIVEYAGKVPAGARKASVSFWKKYSLPLVACIAAIFCVPLVLTGFIRMAGGGSKSESASADTAASEEYYSTTTEAPDAPAEEYFEESVAEESIEEETATTESTGGYFDAEMAETESAPAEEPEAVLDSVLEDGSTDEYIEEENAAAEAAPLGEEKQMADSEESLVLTVIKIARETDDFDDLEAARKEGTLYYLTTDEKGDCTVFVPADQTFVMDLNQKLKIQVEPGNEDYDYIFIRTAE